MYSHFWNKSIAVSSALAAAGVLVCAAAILDAFMPKGSLAAFLASMALLGLVVTGVVIGYTWVCDKCESYFNGRLDRLLSGREPNRRGAASPGDVVGPPPTASQVVGDPRPPPAAPQPPISCSRYVSTLRVTIAPMGVTRATRAHAWHGQ